MKSYESWAPAILNKYIPFVIRIDGKRFSKFTKGMKQPYCPTFLQTMVSTASKVMDEFGAVTAYTQSDEINLVFMPPENEYAEIHSGGKVMKLSSLSAASATASFKHYLREAAEDMEECEYKYLLLDKIQGYEGYFDARVFQIPSNDVLNYVIWRNKDARKNSKMSLARQYLSHNNIMHKTSDELVEILNHQHNVDWNDLPDEFKYGVILKKQHYELEPDVTRTKIVKFSLPIVAYTSTGIDLIHSKVLPVDT